MTAIVPYITFMKHAKKVAKAAPKSRPILRTVDHCEEYVAVTDAHRLYLATDIYEGDRKQVDPNTGLDVDNGEYPDIGKIVPDVSNAKYSSYTVDTTHAYEAVRAIEIAGRVNKATSLMEIKFGDDRVEFSTNNQAGFDVLYSARSSEDTTVLEASHFNTSYIKDVLHVLKDAKVESFEMYYFGNNRPLLFKAGNFTAIVMPVRSELN